MPLANMNFGRININLTMVKNYFICSFEVNIRPACIYGISKKLYSMSNTANIQASQLAFALFLW